MSLKPLALAALAALLPFGLLAHAQDAGPYKVVKIQMVGGDGGFDYVTADPDGRNLYVARSGPAGHIGVFNLDTLAQVGDIPGTSAHGGAVDTATGHGFATSRPVTMFDAKTFAILKKIDVQGNPDGYLNDAYNHHFYVLSHSAPNITVLDDKDGSILATIDIGGAPEQAATDGQGKIYVDIEDKAAIAVIDANTMKMVGKYDLSSKGGGCAGLALDAKNNILFAACRDNKNMVILSATDGHIITDSAHRQRVRRRHLQPRHHGGLQLPGRRHTHRHQGKLPHQLHRGADRSHPRARQGPHARYKDQPDLLHHRRVWPRSRRRASAGSSGPAPRRRPCRWSSSLDARPPRTHDSRLLPDPRHRQTIIAANRRMAFSSGKGHPAQPYTFHVNWRAALP